MAIQQCSTRTIHHTSLPAKPNGDVFRQSAVILAVVVILLLVGSQIAIPECSGTAVDRSLAVLTTSLHTMDMSGASQPTSPLAPESRHCAIHCTLCTIAVPVLPIAATPLLVLLLLALNPAITLLESRFPPIPPPPQFLYR